MGVDSLTTSDEFSVVLTEYNDSGKELSLFILGIQWQYHAGWEPLVKGEFKTSRNGKTITILLSVHKSQRNVFTIGKETELIKKNWLCIYASIIKRNLFIHLSLNSIYLERLYVIKIFSFRRK